MELRPRIQKVLQTYKKAWKDPNTCLAYVWRDVLADLQKDYDAMSTHEMLKLMVSGKLPDAEEVIKIFKEIKQVLSPQQEIPVEQVQPIGTGSYPPPVTAKEPEKIIPFRQQDIHKNLLYIDNGNVYLKLVKEEKERKLGTIDYGSRTLITTRKPSHLFKKSNSYGFNHSLLSTATQFDQILLKVKGGHYVIPVKTILDKGQFLNFLQQGFERQIFLSLGEMEKYKIEKPKKRKQIAV